MKQDLQDKAVEILTQIQSGVPAGADFAAREIPEIAWSYVLYGRAKAEDRIKELEAQTEALRRALHEIVEEWAGSKCGVPVYAQEAYAIGLAKRMYELAVEAMKGQS